MSTVGFYPRTSHIVSHHSTNRAKAISGDVSMIKIYKLFKTDMQAKQHYIYAPLEYTIVKHNHHLGTDVRWDRVNWG
jgi:hypothetical protein